MNQKTNDFIYKPINRPEYQTHTIRREKMPHWDYPAWVTKVTRIAKVNISEEKPVYVSILETGSDREVIDIRLHVNDHPTNAGVYLGYGGCSNLIATLDEYLSGSFFIREE